MDEKTLKEYQKGFNQGYLIAEHLPELATQLSDIKNNSPLIDGLKDGSYQYILDKARENYPSFLKSDRMSDLKKNNEKEKDFEIDKD